MNIDMSSIEIPKRTDQSDMVIKISLTDRQDHVFRQAIKYTIGVECPNLLHNALGNKAIACHSDALRRSINELSMNASRNNIYAFDIETAKFIVKSVEGYNDAKLVDDRSERMVASRVVNIIMKEIDVSIERHEFAYLANVDRIYREADKNTFSIEFDFYYEASSNDFRVHANNVVDGYKRNLATAYIHVIPSVDSEKIGIDYFVSSNGWIDPSIGSYDNLEDARIAAEDLVANKVDELEDEKRKRTEIARATVEAMKLASA